METAKVHKNISVTELFWERAQKLYPNQISSMVDDFLCALTALPDTFNDYDLEELRMREQELQQKNQENNMQLLEIKTKRQAIEAQLREKQNAEKKAKEGEFDKLIAAQDAWFAVRHER